MHNSAIALLNYSAMGGGVCGLLDNIKWDVTRVARCEAVAEEERAGGVGGNVRSQELRLHTVDQGGYEGLQS